MLSWSSVIKKKIGFISFIPNTGHIIPLVKLASAFKRNGYSIVCYYPDECRGYIEEYDIPVKYYGNLTSKIDNNLFSIFSRKPFFYNDFTCYIDLYKKYFSPINIMVSKKIKKIKEMIIKDNIRLLIGDALEWSNFWSKYISLSLNLPLVFNYSEGNLRQYRNYYDKIYGFNQDSKIRKKIITKLGYHINSYFSTAKITPEIIKLLIIIIPILEKYFPNVSKEQVEKYKPDEIISGISYLEINNLKIPFEKPINKKLYFPPVLEKKQKNIPIQIQKWIDKSTNIPIVYISFGTIVKARIPVIKKIIKGLKNHNIRILWSAPGMKNKIKKIYKNTDMLIEEYVPQQSVLASDKVKCFITHGGAGSVLESLSNGKPMLCIPFMFDQPYNSSIVEELNTGIKINKNKISAKIIFKSLQKLLYDKKYINSAKHIMKQLKDAEDGGPQIIKYFENSGLINRNFKI